jgi:hypothetical protein
VYEVDERYSTTEALAGGATRRRRGIGLHHSGTVFEESSMSETIAGTASLVLDAEALYRELLRGVRSLMGANTRWRASPPAAPGWSSACTRTWSARQPGVLSSALHRDDFAQRGMASSADAARLRCERRRHPGAGRCALHRPHRARRAQRAVRLRPPGSVRLAVLVDRGGRELPVAADFAAARVACLPASRWRWRARRRHLPLAVKRPERAVQAQPQLNKNGELIHLLSTEGLSKDILTQILDTASNFVSVNDREVKKVPLLRGKSVFNLFFENSTRTRTTFEIAAKRLSADVFNLDIARSSTARARRCWTPSTTSRPWRPTSLSCATASRARPT